MSPLRELNPDAGDPPLNAVGVYEVEVGSDTNHETLREAITDKLNEDWPGTNLPSVSWGELDPSVPFDHVMYCMPPNVQMGIACKCNNACRSDSFLSCISRINLNVKQMPLSTHGSAYTKIHGAIPCLWDA